MGNTMTGYEEEENDTEVGDTTGEDLYAIYEDAYNALKNRGAFGYSVENDPIYQQYRSAAEKSGKLAMKDTVGQISAQNGGYANSYAQTAGQQMYQSALDNVDNMIPELYDVARQRYDNETAALQNRLDTAADAYSTWKENETERIKASVPKTMSFADFNSAVDEFNETILLCSEETEENKAKLDAAVAKIDTYEKTDAQTVYFMNLLPEWYLNTLLEDEMTGEGTKVPSLAPDIAADVNNTLDVVLPVATSVPDINVPDEEMIRLILPSGKK